MTKIEKIKEQLEQLEQLTKKYTQLIQGCSRVHLTFENDSEKFEFTLESSAYEYTRVINELLSDCAEQISEVKSRLIYLINEL